jgi:hypothetical protein
MLPPAIGRAPFRAAATEKSVAVTVKGSISGLSATSDRSADRRSRIRAVFGVQTEVMLVQPEGDIRSGGGHNTAAVMR